MSAGLPIKFYTLDDSVMFHLKSIRRCKLMNFAHEKHTSKVTSTSTMKPLTLDPSISLEPSYWLSDSSHDGGGSIY